MDTSSPSTLPISAPALAAWDRARRRQEDAERQLERARQDVIAGIGSVGVVVASMVCLSVRRSETRAAFRALNWPYSGDSAR